MIHALKRWWNNAQGIEAATEAHAVRIEQLERENAELRERAGTAPPEQPVSAWIGRVSHGA